MALNLRNTLVLSALTVSAYAGGKQGRVNGAEQSLPAHPNIIYILADDMGYGDVRAFNAESRIPTPALDSMASAGIIFTDAHSNSSVSTPTRYGTLTGRYAFRSRLKAGVLTGYSAPLIENDRETVASFLGKHGYRTACIGKWHLGLDWTKKDAGKPLFTGTEWNLEDTGNVDYGARIGGGPADCGFDYSCILPASLDMPPYVYVENGKVTASVNGYTEDYMKKGVRGARYRHGDVADDFNHQECLDYFTRKSEDYVRQAATCDEPYFLYLALTAPHAPWLPERKFRGRSGAGAYGDFVCMVDEVVRRIHKAVERSGKAENTLIIFTTDNGAMWLEEEVRQTGHRANGGWSGAKSDLWEGGHRVPWLATWPAVIAPGSRSGQLISSTDLLATLAEMLGEPLPDGAGEDSFSFWQDLSGKVKKGTDGRRRSMVYHSVNGSFALRKGDWVFVDCKGSGGWTLPEEKTAGLPEVQLYDLKNDASQKKNVAALHPDIVLEMKRELERIKRK